MNNQPIEPATKSTDVLDVQSVYETIQGEGPFTGVPCVMVRLAGCNMQCPACDTNYTSMRYTATPEQLLERVTQLRSHGLVVITGGEPLRQQIDIFIDLLLDSDCYYVQIETNGTFAPPDLAFHHRFEDRRGVYLVCSPKTPHIHPEVLQKVAAFKYVLSANAVFVFDGLPTTALGVIQTPGKYIARPPEDWSGPVYLQPVDDDDYYGNLEATVQSCLEYGYTLQLQTHKFMGLYQ